MFDTARIMQYIVELWFKD